MDGPEKVFSKIALLSTAIQCIQGMDVPGERVLNERQVLHDLSERKREGEGCSSCSPKARIV